MSQLLNCIYEIRYFNECNRDRFIRNIALSIPSGSKVLDAGAGSCKYRQLFDHCDYEAQDFAQYEQQGHKYGDLDYIGDITAIPVPDASFDCVICTEVLEHLPHPDMAIREFARILKPGGQLIITAPLSSGIHMEPFHFYGGFTPFWYRHFLPKYGFAPDEIIANGGFFRFYGQESQRFISLLYPRKNWLHIAFFPVWLSLKVWFKVVVPMACHALDRFDREQHFTVGYFVKARRTGPDGSG